MYKTPLVEKSIQAALERKFSEEEFSDCYIVEIQVDKSEKVVVYIDSDGPLTLGKCQKISRFLEKEIEEKKWLGEKYTLEVSSPGTERPLLTERQYRKNIGRNIHIQCMDDSILEGKLLNVDEANITILEALKKEEKQHVLPYNKIKEAKILLSFK